MKLFKALFGAKRAANGARRREDVESVIRGIREVQTEWRAWAVREGLLSPEEAAAKEEASERAFRTRPTVALTKAEIEERVRVLREARSEFHNALLGGAS